jgi:hypothetical protein
MKAVILVSFAAFIATMFAPIWSNSPPGDIVHEGELERIAGLQCDYKSVNKSPCASENSVSSCGWWPCISGACGTDAYGYKCWTSSVGKACYNCTGSANQVCASGGVTNSFCYMTSALCCTSSGTCYERVTPDPSLGPNARRFSCVCDTLLPVQHETRTVTTVTPNDPKCTPKKPPTYVGPDGPLTE